MKPIFVALVIIALASPATSQGNSPHAVGNAMSAPPPAPPSGLAHQASDACRRLPESIDSKTWSESSVVYDGPARVEVESRLSQDGVSAIIACFPK